LINLRTLAFNIFAIICATSANAQQLMCDRKLSVLTADVQQMGLNLAEIEHRILQVSESFLKDESYAQIACPVGVSEIMSEHQVAISKIKIEPILNDAIKDLFCTQLFSQRVQDDMHKAQTEGKAQMAQKLLTISKKIIVIDFAATRQASDAVFLQSKKARLLEGVNNIIAHCDSLGDLYE
jgi:hypothetical protein